ncbi:ZIP family metal transporter [Clostridium sp. Sa3CUN1]|uniref:ZIP family metal transporter n=1 Tax=Clostridium gallinarum TaxID=2762246 RepID=A0ABR8Q5T6_9CLOT|nr:ZIP family metal transporter [Clostridium gallinarum]MBD7915778.1 ZIP family metal transporter [Clostridium gallinarum]
MEWFIGLSPIFQGLLATLFTWFVTALGAAVVFFFKKFDKRILNTMLGFGAGVMIAASFWSLLSPAIELSEQLGYSGFVIPSIGFFLGGAFLIFADKLMDTYSYGVVLNKEDNISKTSKYRKSILLVLAVTLHNIPEGLAVGVAFGGVAAGIPGTSVVAALTLALGIGLQNFPEGAAVSLPLRSEGLSRTRSFLYGQASGLVEPISGVIGVIAALTVRSLLPFLLSFSAGAMIAVVGAELLPEASLENKKLTTLGLILGFIVMMVLDVALG